MEGQASGSTIQSDTSKDVDQPEKCYHLEGSTLPKKKKKGK